MIGIPEHLRLALEADDRDRLERIISEGNPGDFAVLQALVQDAGTPSTYRRKAMYALSKWPDRNEPAVAAIAAALPQLNELERITAVDALGRIGTADALDVVLNYTTDDAADVRRQVVKTLHQIGSARALNALERIAATEEVDYVRSIAQQKLQDARGRENQTE